MARMLSITRSGEGSGARKRGIDQSMKFGPITLSIMTIALVGFLALFFIVSTTSTSAEGFELHQLEERADKLEDQNQTLEVELSKLQSLDHLEKSIEDSHINFVPVTKVTTIRLTDDSVAVTNQ